jgi:hypothetical protein
MATKNFVIRHFLACLLVLISTQAQSQEKVHMLHAGKLPPGAIGAQQLLRGGPLPGYFQPVEIRAPEGALVSLAIDQQFSAPQTVPFKVGMLIAPVYRLRVTQIPNHTGEEVYPTVEIINRIYPPVGEEFRFPIPIDLTQAELELALAGKFVTRVVYLEDPQQAVPIATAPDEQRYFEVRPSDDPLEVADRLGRPVAIIRLGGRLPDANGPDAKFLFGSPPVLVPNSLDLYSDPAATSVEPIPQTAAKREVRSNDTKTVARESAAIQISDRSTTTSERAQTLNAAPSVRLASSAAMATDRAPDGHPVVSLGSEFEWQLNKPAPVAVSVSDDE